MKPFEGQALALNGIDADTGEPLVRRATLAQVAALACGEPPAPDEIAELRLVRTWLRKDHLETRFQIDSRNLAETGWGVVFPAGRQKELRAALAPLLDLRRAQAGSIEENRYKELIYHHGESKPRFLARHGVGPGPVNPDIAPYYLLIVGDPSEIPFRFQHQLDVQYAVGRLSFATAEEYARYAESVVAAEKGAVARNRQVSLFGMSHPGDAATALSRRKLVQPLAASLSRDWSAWTFETVTGEQTRREALLERMGGPTTPALLFSASHGLGFRTDDSRQIAHQGALLCGNWPGSGHGPVSRDCYLAAEDILDSASPAGLIAFLFACYGGGTPLYDSFAENGARRQIAAAPFVARLPQRLLTHPRGGALAVIAHVDRCWTFSFDWPKAGGQLSVFESTLGRLLDGYPIGAAMEYFNQRYAELAADLNDETREIQWGAEPDLLSLSDLWAAHNDARSYVVLGDPAVRLAVAPTTAS